MMLDSDYTTPTYVFSYAAVVLALGVTYWLVGKTGKTYTDPER